MVWKPRRLDEFVKYYEWRLPYFLEGYRKRVKNYYLDEFEKSPDCFPLMKPVTDISVFSNFEIDHYFCNSSDNSDQFVAAFNIFEDQKEYVEIMDLPDHLQEKRKLEIAGLSKSDYLIHTRSWYGETDDPKPHYDEALEKRRGAHLADKHYNEYSKQLSVTSKESRYHLFDIEPIISQVGNDDFQYEFEEAIKAYNKGLYLASTVTAAISIETLLKIVVLRTLGEKQLPKPYYILSMAELLHKNKIIDDRLYHRIISFNEIRRSAAHSKTGRVNEWDAEQGIALIKIIVESLF